MLFTVIRPFKNIDGAFLKVGDTIECDLKRAAVLRRNGMIGNIADKPSGSVPEKKKVETAEEKPVKRHYRKRHSEE